MPGYFCISDSVHTYFKSLLSKIYTKYIIKEIKKATNKEKNTCVYVFFKNTCVYVYVLQSNALELILNMSSNHQ